MGGERGGQWFGNGVRGTGKGAGGGEQRPDARTWEPVLEGGEVGARRGAPVLEDLDRAPGAHQDAEAGGAADGLLAGRQHDVDAPLVEADLLAAHAADAVDDDERLGADFVHEFRQRLDLAQDAGARVDVRHRQELVLLLPQRGLHVRQLGPVPDRRLKLRGPHAVRLEAVGERVREVARVQDQHVLVPLRQVGRHQVPAQGAAAGDDERLGVRPHGLEQLAEHGEGVAEGVHERHADVGLAAAMGSVEKEHGVGGVPRLPTCNGSCSGGPHRRTQWARGSAALDVPPGSTCWVSSSSRSRRRRLGVRIA